MIWATPLLIGLLLGKAGVSGAPDTQCASAARAAYLVRAAFGQFATLTELQAEMTAGAGDIGGALRRVLAGAGLHVEAVALSVEELQRWPHLAILSLPAPGGGTRERFGVFVGGNGDRITLMDPNPFGRLARWTRDELAAQWNGRALLVSPTPFRVRLPWRPALWCSAIVLAALVVLGLLVRIGRRGAVGALPLLLVFVAGCGGSAAPPARGNRPRLLEQAWQTGDCYPTTLERSFTIRNDQAVPIRVAEATTSCGCIAVGLPVGVEIPPDGSHDFKLSIDLTATRGPTSHTITIVYSDARREAIRFNAVVKRGVVARPGDLTFHLAAPGDVASQRVALESDDGGEFSITGASAEAARVAISGNAVEVAYSHDNRTSFRDDVLKITTTHPRAQELRVPIRVRYDLTWELRPPGFYYHTRPDGSFVERTVTVVSTSGSLFTVAPAQSDDVVVTPLSVAPSPVQDVRIRLRCPVVRGAPRRIVATLVTTLHDAPEIAVPCVFYR